MMGNIRKREETCMTKGNYAAVQKRKKEGNYANSPSASSKEKWPCWVFMCTSLDLWVHKLDSVKGEKSSQWRK